VPGLVAEWARALSPAANGLGRQPLSTAVEESAVAGKTEVVVDVLRLRSPEEEAKPAA
jgi:hypothetical protein